MGLFSAGSSVDSRDCRDNSEDDHTHASFADLDCAIRDYGLAGGCGNQADPDPRAFAGSSSYTRGWNCLHRWSGVLCSTPPAVQPFYLASVRDCRNRLPLPRGVVVRSVTRQDYRITFYPEILKIL